MHVFISYSTKDADFVERLTADLQAAGIDVWIDTHDLLVGTPSWEQALRDAIQAARALIFVASPNSRHSPYVRDELTIADMVNCPIFPIWADGIAWAESAPLGKLGVQYVDARGDLYASALAKLIGVLNTQPHHLPHHLPQSPFTPTVPPDFVPRNPFKGLQAFRQEDRGDYFGRDQFIDELIAFLPTQGPRFLAVVGASGSGKSSLVMAGLLPRLKEGALPNSPQWVYLDPVLPGPYPIAELATALAAKLNTSITSVEEDLRKSPRALHLRCQQFGRETIVFIDQFEELFTLTPDPAEREQFINLLVAAATEPRGRAWIILTLRADFYERPLKFREFARLLESRQKTVLPLALNELHAVIVNPTQLPDVQLTFEDGLVSEILFEVRDEIGALPLLQFTMQQLVDQRTERRLTHAAYHAMGGVRGALAKHANTIYEGLSTTIQKNLARDLFLRLLELGETDVTRRRIAWDELVTPDENLTAALQVVTNTFVDARLLTTNQQGGIATVEIIHEALLKEWQVLNHWLQTKRDDKRLQELLSRDALEWSRRNKRRDDLYRGEKLREMLDWAERNTPSAAEMEFLQAAQAEAQFRQDELASRSLEQELMLAQNIILSTLPTHTPDIDKAEIAALYQAARVVGGDFYLISPLGNDKYGLAVGDIADKGIPAALFMLLVRTILRSVIITTLSPKVVLERVNTMLLQDSRSDIFATIWYGVYDAAAATLTYASGGHNAALLLKGTGELQTLRAKGIAIGVFDPITLAEETIQLHSGDVLTLFTDGLVEASNSAYDYFGESRIESTLRAHQTLSANEIANQLLAAANAFTEDTPNFDDLTLVVLKKL